MAAVAVLCINLDRAPQRWLNIQAMAGRLHSAVPDVKRAGVTRIQAVAGDTLDPADPAVPLSVLARWRLQHRAAVCSSPPVDSLSAVGCYLSHVRCWEWLRRHPEIAYALILEDDVCLSDAFDRAWAATVGPLLSAVPPVLDLLVLGYENRAVQFQGPLTPYRSVTVHGQRLHDRHWFVGSHCYVVGQRGAARLLQTALPVELHVDYYLCMCMHLGLVAGYLLPESAADQCLGRTETAIVHFDALRTNYKKYLPFLDVAVSRLTAAAMVAAVVVVALFVCQKSKQPR